MERDLNAILDMLPDIKKKVAEQKELLLSNAVIIGEIPAPTFGEKQRVDCLRERFNIAGLTNTSTDEADNALGVLSGKDADKNILLVAHTDTVFPRTGDHTISVQTDHLRGIGIADDTLGLATLCTIPTILERLGITLNSNLIVMGASRSLARGNLEGLRFFLENNTRPINAAVCVEGVQLGRLSLKSIGMLRGEITCSVPEQYDWTRFGSTNAILILNEVINRILELPMPTRPQTSVVLGSISGGTSFNTIATSAELGFEIRSESSDKAHDVARQMSDIAAEVGSQRGVDVNLDIFASRDTGGITFSHPLAHCTREIMRRLDIDMGLAPSTSELSALIKKGIPALTVGMTTCERLNLPNERVYIEPMFTGIAQLIGILLCIDGGLCNES